jgi:hypothetical protein
MTNQTPARSALHESIQRTSQAREAVNSARASHDRDRAQVERAQELVRSHQAALQEHDDKIAEHVGPDGLPPAPSPKQREARCVLEDNLAHTARTLKIVEGHAEESRKAYDAAVVALTTLEREINDRILPVVEEEAERLLAEWQEARLAAIDAERSVRSKIQALTTKQHFALAERLTNSFREGVQRQREYTTNTAPYLNFIERLRTDADAELVL